MGPTILLLAVLGASPDSPDPADRARVDFFEAKVRPVLDAHCVQCHGPARRKAGLRLDSKADAMRGGDSGPAIAPGQPDASRLVEAIRYAGDSPMPPKGKLHDREIADLVEWVRSGAAWPEPTLDVRPASAPTGKVTAEDRDYWAFRPVADPPLPEVKDTAWVKSPIDRFVLSQLESKGLHPVGPADKHALIRRATFDLIGLPPTPEDVAAFVLDDSPGAFAKVVDRLLASPHHGERWGRHWLDVARYGEDQAHTFEARKYPNGYKYRDWVVRSINDDKPYDRFIVEQIAGDLLDEPGRDARLAATGFFALGPVYYGGAVFDELDDRVDTLTRGFLGLTVACARCHDHKFDPIPTSDYYALAGVFSSSAYKEVPDAPPEVVAAYDKGQAAIKARQAEVDGYLKAEGTKWSAAATANETARYLVAAWALADRRKAEPGLATAGFAKERKLEAFLLDRWTNLDLNKPHLARCRKLVEGRDGPTAEAFQAYVRSTQALRDAVESQRAAATAIGLEPRATLDGPDLEVVREVEALFALPKDQVEKFLTDEAKAGLRSRRNELNLARSEAPKMYPVVHSIADAPKPGDMKVFLRGNPATPGPVAPRAFLAVLSPENATPFTQGSGRLELARAIASPDNPLTARVMVNRVWEHHFGRGLVATPSNFGKMGERPSHPELLDHLARRFVASGWSLKTLHREITLSATYQLSASTDPKAVESDPGNVLLWRANRRRLEVEPWRDSMLSVAGTLDPKVGGKSVDLASPDNRRRTFYARVSRHSLDGLLRLFDFPDPNITSDKRPVTAVPLQQLFVLNSEFMDRQSRALAARLAGMAGDDASRVRAAYPILYAREATDAEVRLGVDFLSGPPAEGDQPTRWERYAQALLASNEFTFID